MTALNETLPPPPPYSGPSCTSSKTIALETSGSSSSASSTPLPSYHTSPVIPPTLTHAPPPLDATATPATTTAELPNLPTAPPLPGHAHKTSSPTNRCIKLALTAALALLGAPIVDTAYLTLLNTLGFALTLLHLPLAIVLAHELNKPQPTTPTFAPSPPKHISQNTPFPTPRTHPQQGWIKHFTQCAWDTHDHLEEAELHPPSTWV